MRIRTLGSSSGGQRRIIMATKFCLTISLLMLLLACGSEPVLTVTPAPTATPQSWPTPLPTATPAATVTPRPYPTPLPLPTATLTPTVTPVPTAAGYWPDVYSYMVEFLVRHGERANATPEEKLAADFLAEDLKGFGYEVSVQDFEFKREWAALVINGEVMGAHYMSNSAHGEAIAPLAYVGASISEEMPDEALKDKVLLFRRGEIYFQAMGEIAQEKGALGVLVFNNEEGDFTGRVDTGTVPIVSISQEYGQELVAALDEGESVNINLSTGGETFQSHNVIGDKPAEANAERTLYLVAHYDTQDAGTIGAEDNASGVAVAMQAAKAIANRDLSFKVRVLMVGGIDAGTQEYIASMTEDEREELIGAINVDTVSSGRIDLVGPGEIPALAGTVAGELGIEYDSMDIHPRYYSADEYFNEEGFDALWIRAFIPHEGEDRIEYVSPDNLVDALEIVLGVIERLNEE